jgi:hypothetical protein
MIGLSKIKPVLKSILKAITMKALFSTIILAMFAFVSFGQDASKMPSPAATAKGSINGSDITISYSQPAVKGRQIWGKLVPYNEVWRTGANNATSFETSKDITIEGKALKAGKYALFTIPAENGEWTVIFNKNFKQWGSYGYKEAEDVLRVKVKATKASEMAERLTFSVNKDNVSLAWDALSVAFGVK